MIRNAKTLTGNLGLRINIYASAFIFQLHDVTERNPYAWNEELFIDRQMQNVFISFSLHVWDRFYFFKTFIDCGQTFA